MQPALITHLLGVPGSPAGTPTPSGRWRAALRSHPRCTSGALRNAGKQPIGSSRSWPRLRHVPANTGGNTATELGQGNRARDPRVVAGTADALGVSPVWGQAGNGGQAFPVRVCRQGTPLRPNEPYSCNCSRGAQRRLGLRGAAAQPRDAHSPPLRDAHSPSAPGTLKLVFTSTIVLGASSEDAPAGTLAGRGRMSAANQHAVTAARRRKLWWRAPIGASRVLWWPPASLKLRAVHGRSLLRRAGAKLASRAECVVAVGDAGAGGRERVESS